MYDVKYIAISHWINLLWTSSEFQLASTIILILQVHRLTMEVIKRRRNNSEKQPRFSN